MGYNVSLGYPKVSRIRWEILDMYKKGVCTEDIAHYLGVSTKVVIMSLKREGVKLR